MENRIQDSRTSDEILKTITENLDKEIILSILKEYNLKLSEEKSKEAELWRTPFAKSKTFWVVVFILIIGTIYKFLSRCIVLDYGKPIRTDVLSYDLLDLIIYGFWIIVPPVFFLYEYVIHFGKDERRRLDSDQTADIKYCQELSSKIWAGLALFFSVLLGVKYGLNIN